MNPYIIILVIVTVSGIAISVWGWRVLKTSQKTRNWPSVDGVIEVSTPSSAEDDLLPHIVFHYQINGAELRNRFEFPSGTSPLPEFAEAYAKKYPVGATVKVYYNPQDPQQSTLEPSARGDWMILALGVLMALGGLATLLTAP